ncbi:programmed cell death protein 2 [Lineolata rhizophorae]|uniref:Programmed cell death protein 2 n=1 Tax=Lineolata rhizophorae TaxID=578093 RepID=A0A6A6P6Q2_9PEZI|nr:programmed cell death protein 2 [Lineolata rhizophorae]
MPPYDSDSSGDEVDEDFTETNVLLGYASKEPTDDNVSHLGGFPTWLDPSTPPPGALAKCKTCNGLLTLLLQLNGDMPDRFPAHERRLYVFSCRRKACRRKAGSVRALRGVRVSESASVAVGDAEKPAATGLDGDKAEQKEWVSPQERLSLGGKLFGSGSSVSEPASPAASARPNPFSAAAASQAPANPFSRPAPPPLSPFSTASSLAAKPPQKPDEPSPSATASTTLPESFASKVRLSSPESTATTTTTTSSSSSPQPAAPPEPWPPESAFPKPYPLYHLDAEYETLDAAKPAPLPAHARMELDDGGSGGGSSGGGKDDSKDAFESSLDRAFQRFADRLAQNPEQVLRYEFGGAPLLYSRDDAVGRALAPAEPGSAAAGAPRIATVSAAAGGPAGGMPRCANCGAARVFEAQLTPHAIAELEAEELGLEGMDWGTVILAVCERDCEPAHVREGQVGYVEEWAGVQWEEVGKMPGKA